MAHRPRLFLTFSVICVTPLLILSGVSFRSSLKSTEALLRNNLADELDQVAHHYTTRVRERDRELAAIASGPLSDYVRSARTPDAVALIDSADRSPASGAAGEAAYAARVAIKNLPLYYANIACYGADKHLMFLNQPTGHEKQNFRTKDFLPGVIEPDEGVWDRKPGSPARCSIVSDPQFGDLRRCSVLILLTADPESNAPRGVLVADIKVGDLFRETDLGRGAANENDRLNRQVIVLDSAGKIVYCANETVQHQPVSTALPEFARVAAAMIGKRDRGAGEYQSPAGDTWVVAHQPVDVPGLSLAVARNYSQATKEQRRAGWLGIGLSLLFGFGGAALLTAYFQKKTQRIERLTETVAQVAGGNFGQRVEAPSSEELRPIADSVNVISNRLREQIAREAEAHQFQSFIKLSALLTHDLKNAIEALSLTVSNMERHFDKPEFRTDALKGLTSATDKLRALVARLSNPVNTLSGEFKMPRPTDLVPMLNRVLAQHAEPLSRSYEVDVQLPPSLFALADAERIEKVMENLVINAFEAMASNDGKLTVAAGAADSGKVFFSVSDTGVGMSPEFIQQKLFRPFATTKQRGVGLGLYTCREVVRANGGTIEVDSTEGFGTTFRVVLASAR